MDDNLKPIDEQTLAEFLAGTLPEHRRAEVIRHLIASEDARELLKMSCYALETSKQEVGSRKPSRVDLPPAVLSRTDRNPVRRAIRKPLFTRFVPLTALVLVVGFGLYFSLGPSTDTLRSPDNPEVLELNAPESLSRLAFDWEDVPDTYRYHVVVWNPLEASIVAEFDLNQSEIAHDDATGITLREILDVDRTYAIHVDAIDAQNRLLISSPMVEFSLKP